MNDDIESQDEGSPEPTERPRAVKAVWWTARLLSVGIAGLVIAHWMGGLWPNGWFQLGAALGLGLGIPLGFHRLIRRQVTARGGDARFRLLTLAALVNLPVLLWVAVKEPGTLVDSVTTEGMGGIRYVVAQIGGHTDAVDSVSDAVPPEAQPEQAPRATEAAVLPVAADHEADVTSPAPPLPPPGTPLAFESRGGQMLIEASVGDSAPLPFILDTGASYSTLNASALASLGIEVPADAPVKRMQTAGGEAEGRIVLVDAVTVGAQRREGVAFWVCEPCAVGDAVGLMGLNVWQGYLLTIDPVDQTVFLQPREGQTSRNLDVEPYLDIRAISSRVGDGELVVDLELGNRAARPVRQAVVLVTAMDERGREVGAFTVDAGEVPAGATQTTTGSMPQALKVESVRLELLDAWW
jgi:hypothetical protein